MVRMWSSGGVRYVHVALRRAPAPQRVALATSRTTRVVYIFSISPTRSFRSLTSHYCLGVGFVCPRLRVLAHLLINKDVISGYFEMLVLLRKLHVQHF